MAPFQAEFDKWVEWWEEYNAPLNFILEERQKEKDTFNALLGDIVIDL